MSLRLRLLLVLGAAALVALAAADVAVYAGLRTSLVNGVDGSLTSSSLAVGHLYAPVGPGSGTDGGPGRTGAPGEQPASPPGEQLPDTDFCTMASGLSAGSFVAILGPDKSVLPYGSCPGRTPGGPIYQAVLTGVPVLGPARTGPPAARPVFFDTVGRAGQGPLRAAATALPRGDELVVAVPLGPTNGTLGHLALIELLSGLAALLAALLIGWWLVRIGLRPLAEVERTAVAITAGDLTQRVPGGTRRTEVGRVAGALNSMLGQIEAAFAERDATEADLRASEQRLRRFVADASHELRTPIAAVAAYSELFTKGASEHREDLARVMSGISGETSRMTALVEDLLLLARLDEGRPLERRSVELVTIASDAMHTARAVGPSWPVRLVAAHPVEIEGDPGRLRQVLDNLLSNVRAHTPEGTETTVSVAERDGDAVIEVSDTGPGIPAADVGRLFERFYRADPSRARSSGGAGLGLAIVASIVAAHGGRVAALANEPNGVTFRVTLPIPGRPDPTA